VRFPKEPLRLKPGKGRLDLFFGLRNPRRPSIRLRGAFQFGANLGGQLSFERFVEFRTELNG
jgi:hypothetical protein